MRPMISLVFIVFAGLATACGPSTSPRYPSYEQVISKYAPADNYTGVQVDDTMNSTPHEDCDCPRIWYHDHWVYHHEGRWFYRHHGYWYYYPTFYVHYSDGVPYVYKRSKRSIRKGNRVYRKGDVHGVRRHSSKRGQGSDDSSRGSSRTTRSIRKGDR